MPYKDPEKQKQAQREWYERQDKAKRVEYNRRERIKRRNVVDEYKREHGCSRCGYSKCTRALHFHHRGDEKNFSVADGVIACKAIAEIQREMELCDLICSNCHHEEHCPDC